MQCVIVLWNISVCMLCCSLHTYVTYTSYTLCRFIHSDYEGGTMFLWNNNISHCCTLHKHQNKMNTNSKWSCKLKISYCTKLYRIKKLVYLTCQSFVFYYAYNRLEHVKGFKYSPLFFLSMSSYLGPSHYESAILTWK